MTNSELLKAWYTEVWEKGNTDAIDDFYAPGTNAEELIPNLHVGIEELRDLVVAFRHLLGEIKVNLTKTVEENDWVSDVYEVHTSRADNKEPIYVTGHVMSRIRDGKIVETYNQFNFISLFEQLGQFPQDTLPIGMTGQRLDWA